MSSRPQGGGLKLLSALPQANTHTIKYLKTEGKKPRLSFRPPGMGWDRSGGRWEEVLLSCFECSFMVLQSSLKCPLPSWGTLPPALQQVFWNSRERLGTLRWRWVRLSLVRGERTHSRPFNGLVVLRHWPHPIQTLPDDHRAFDSCCCPTGQATQPLAERSQARSDTKAQWVCSEALQKANRKTASACLLVYLTRLR
ncbi:hypothetical protein AOLI_G00313520 [Acnodon oligacanthus]